MSLNNKQKRDNSFCCVPQCNSRGTKDPQLSFHKFPNPKQNVVIRDIFNKNTFVSRRQEWIKILRIGKDVSNRMVVCSKHFKASDFILPETFNEAVLKLQRAEESSNLETSDGEDDSFLRRKRRFKPKNFRLPGETSDEDSPRTKITKCGSDRSTKTNPPYPKPISNNFNHSANQYSTQEYHEPINITNDHSIHNNFTNMHEQEPYISPTQLSSPQYNINQPHSPQHINSQPHTPQNHMNTHITHTPQHINSQPHTPQNHMNTHITHTPHSYHSTPSSSNDYLSPPFYTNHHPNPTKNTELPRGVALILGELKTWMAEIAKKLSTLEDKVDNLTRSTTSSSNFTNLEDNSALIGNLPCTTLEGFLELDDNLKENRQLQKSMEHARRVFQQLQRLFLENQSATG